MDAEYSEVADAVASQMVLLGVTRKDEPLLWTLAYELAHTLDRTSSAREIPTIARELRAVMDELAARAEPMRTEADPLDDLSARRAARFSLPTGTDGSPAGGHTGP
jgi:hypothetical protein